MVADEVRTLAQKTCCRQPPTLLALIDELNLQTQLGHGHPGRTRAPKIAKEGETPCVAEFAGAMVGGSIVLSP